MAYPFSQNNGYQNTYAPYPQYYPQNIQAQPVQQAQAQFQPVMQQAQPQAQPSTNILYAISLDEALAKTLVPNSIFVYRDQAKPLEYEISVDMQGRKTSRVICLSEPKQEEAVKEAFVAQSAFEQYKKEASEQYQKELDGYKKKLSQFEKELKELKEQAEL